MQLKSKFIFGSILAGLLSTTSAFADLKISSIGTSANTPVMNDSGDVAAESDTNSLPVVYNSNGSKRSLKGYNFSPSAINNKGDVVGQSYVYDGGSGTYKYFFFFSKNGEASQPIYTTDGNVYSTSYQASLNDSDRIIIVKSDVILFFDQEKSVAQVPAAASDIFDTQNNLVVLSNGKALVRTSHFGNYFWSIVSSDGSIQLLSNKIISPSAQNLRVFSDGELAFQDNGTLYKTDLIHPAVKYSSVHLPGVKNANLLHLDANPTGQSLVSDVTIRQVRPLGLQTSDYAIGFSTKPISLNCLTSNRANLQIQSALRVANNGTVLVSTASKNGSGYAAINGLSAGDARNYCVKTTIRVAGECAKHFAGLNGTSDIPVGTKCNVIVNVKDEKGKALSGMTVATDNGVVRGKTDIKGQSSFTFKVRDPYSGQMAVKAPFNDKQYLFNEGDINYSGKK